MVRFQLVELEYQDGPTDGIGVLRDNWLDEQNPTRNNGINNKLFVGYGKTSPARQDVRTVLEIQMPREEDIVGFDVLEKVELVLHLSNKDASKWMHIGIVEISDIWDEGSLVESPGYSNWTDAQPSVPWQNGNGAIKSRVGSLNDEDTVIDSVRNTLVAGVYTDKFDTWDLTPVLGMGDKKSFVIFDLDREDNTKNIIRYHSNQGTPFPLPILRITYRDFPPEGFTDDADKLRIIPNPDNPEQPKLTWGAVDAPDFSQYKVYRDTNPITSIDGFKSAITAVSTGSDYFEIDGDHLAAFPVGSTFKITGRAAENGRFTVAASSIVSGDTRIEVDEDVTVATVDGDIHHGIWTSIDSASEEFIDTDTLTNGTTYYYRVIVEDQDNHEDNALRSATVSFTKPDITTATMSPSGAQSVGIETTLTVTSPQNIKRVYVDWKDGIQSWYAFDIVGTSKAVTHIFTNHSASALTPDVRIEDELGFWSAIEAASNTITPDDTAPTAKVLVNVKKDHVGVEVTLNGALSQPKGSNVTITKYEFKRYSGDSWQDNGTNPVFSFSTTGFSVGSKTAELRITTSTSLQDTDTVDYELESGDPVELEFSRNTRIHEIPHELTFEKEFRAPLDGDGIEYQFKTARRAERITIHGTTHTPDMDTDISIIRDAWDNDTYIRVRVKNEVEGKDVLYDGKIESDVSLGHSYPNLITWSFNMVVFDRTEV